MSIRRKRRQRGKRKEIRKQALQAWARLQTVSRQPKTNDLKDYWSQVAAQLASVQPMQVPRFSSAFMSFGRSNRLFSRVSSPRRLKKKQQGWEK